MVHHGVPQSYSPRPRCLQPFASINRSRLILWSHCHSLSQSQQINLALNALISLNSLGGGDLIIWCGKDVTVTTDDFSLEQKERAQQRQTEQRRQERSRRNRLILFAAHSMQVQSWVTRASQMRAFLRKLIVTVFLDCGSGKGACGCLARQTHVQD